MTTFLKGTGVALVTPFNKDRSIDFDSLERILHHQIKSGMDYLVALGTTGETATINDTERFAILDFIAEKVDGKVPLVAGFGGNDTQHVIDSLKAYKRIDTYQAILSVSPYYNKPNQRGLYLHYKAIAEHSPLPIILYNVPSRTGSNMEALTTVTLGKELENIVGVKEASGNLNQIMEIVKTRAEGFLVISGDDILTMPMMGVGIDGLISVLGNAYPNKIAQMVRHALEGDFSSAQQIHFELLGMMHLIFEEGNPTGVKALMNTMGLLENTLRLPLASASPDLFHRIAQLSKQMSPELV